MAGPWRNLKEAAARLGANRSRNFVAREIKAGRLKAARIGGRGEYLTCDAWIDEWVEEQAKPVMVVRRRA
jgi:hypothetical protein